MTPTTTGRDQALEPARFLGFTGTDWAIAGIAVVGVGGALAVLWIRRRRRSTPPGAARELPRT